MSNSSTSSSSDDEHKKTSSRKRDRKRKKEKKTKKHKSRRRDERHSSKLRYDSDSDSHHERRKRRRKEKKSSRKDHSGERSLDGSLEPSLDRNHALASALCRLLDSYPSFASDLPLMLMRLASGTTFDLSQMSDPNAADSLAQVFSELEPFGVTRDGSSWAWKTADRRCGSQCSSGSKNELVLVRVVRAMLDQIGVTVAAVQEFEEQGTREASMPAAAKDSKPSATAATDVTRGDTGIESTVRHLLEQFPGGKLASELAGLCNLILEGESVAVDSLPDERLKGGLEHLFSVCGLEKAEMEKDSDEDEDEKASGSDTAAELPTMGYGLPDEATLGTSRETLEAVIRFCNASAVAQETSRKQRIIKGPTPRPAAYQESDEDDDVGPAPFGAKEHSAPSLSAEQIKAQAAQRHRELHLAKTGVDEGAPTDPNTREEWMLVPGKFDFLGSIQSSGQPIRSRTFEAKSVGAASAAASRQIDPAVQAELDAIMQAHQESRGPSLMELHREKKAQEQAAKTQAGGQKESWKWDRDNDLDAGRRVDKNALKMILGGAAAGLKDKFQGGFG